MERYHCLVTVYQLTLLLRNYCIFWPEKNEDFSTIFTLHLILLYSNHRTAFTTVLGAL